MIFLWRNFRSCYVILLFLFNNNFYLKKSKLRFYCHKSWSNLIDYNRFCAYTSRPQDGAVVHWGKKFI